MPHRKKAGKDSIVEWVEQLKVQGKLTHKAALDIGVGEGTYLYQLKHKYKFVTGADKYQTLE